MATLTVYAATADGYLFESALLYADAQAGASPTVENTTELFTGQAFALGTYRVYESFVSFVTSSITSQDVINSVALSLVGQQDSSATDFVLQARLFDWSGTLDTTDWRTPAQLSALPLLATLDIATNGWALGTTHTFTENGTTFRSNIATGAGAVTRFMLTSDRFVATTTPSGNEYVVAHSADVTGTTDDPVLVINYTTSVIDTSTNSNATAYMNQRKLDRCQNGVAWAMFWNGTSTTTESMEFWYSDDNGETWTDPGTGSYFGFTGTGTTRVPYASMFIDLDDYAHVIYRDRNNSTMQYRRGTPNAGRTAWTWSSALQLDAGTTLDYADLIAHREGTGWAVHIVTSISASGSDRVHAWRLSITSGGVVTNHGATALGGPYNNSTPKYPSIDFNHTGDGKTVAGSTPHLYVGWTAGARLSGFGLRFKKATYSAGTWSWGTEREIDNDVYVGSGSLYSMQCMFDGTRVVMVAPMIVSGSWWGTYIWDRDAADTTTTRRELFFQNSNANYLVSGSSTYDADGNIYLFGRDNTGASGTRLLNYRKWTRSGETLGDIVTIESTGNSFPYVSAKRGYSNSRIEFIYTDGTASPFDIRYDSIAVPVVNATATPGVIAATVATPAATTIRNVIDTSTNSTATAFARHLDRCQNGVLWACFHNGTGATDSVGGDSIEFWYSTNDGVSWTQNTADNFGFQGTASGTVHVSFFIDLDDYAHVVYRDRHDGNLYYRRGTPGAGSTSYTWNTPVNLEVTTALQYPQVVAHREGTGWVAHVVATRGATVGDPTYWPITITSGGSVSVGTSVPLNATGYGNSNHTFPWIDFHHTGDGKTVKDGAPHLYVAWNAGVFGAGAGIRFKKATYSGGTWSWGTERQIANMSIIIGGGWLNCAFDGTRVLIGGFAQGVSSALYHILYERDADDTTTTEQVLALDTNTAGDPEAVYGSMAYDGAKNVYQIGRDNNTGSNELYAVKWTRSTGAVSRIKLGDLTTGTPYPSVRHDSTGSFLIEYIYVNGASSPYQVAYGSLAAPDATVTPGAIAAIVALPAATPSAAGGGATATPGTIGCIVAAPAVSVAASATVQPAVIACTVAMPAPAITLSKTVSLAVTAVIVAAPAPATTASTTRGPPAIAVVVATPAATLVTNSSITPATIPVVVGVTAGVGLDETISPVYIPVPVSAPPATTAEAQDATATPATIAVVAALPAATATGSTNATATPDTIVATTTLPAAATSTSTTTAPATIPVTTTAPAASVTIGATRAPAVIAVPTSAPAASTTATAERAPAVIAAVVATPAATTSASASTSPATIVATTTLPLATAASTTLVTATTIAAATTLPSASTTATAERTPDTIAVLTSAPASSATVGADRAPATIAAVVSTPAASTATATTPTPATIAAVVATPAAAALVDWTTEPATITATTTAPAAAVQVDVARAPAVIAVLVSAPAATLVLDASRAPDTIAVTTTLPVAAVGGSASTTPATIQTFVGVSSGIGLDQTITPVSFQAESALPAPTVTESTDATTTPDVIPVVTALGAPTIIEGSDQTVTPAVTAVTAALDAATTSAGATVSPDTIAVVVGMPSAAAQAGAGTTVQPDSIAATATLHSVTITKTAERGPPTIAATVTVPQATASGSRTVEPAVTAVTTAFPAATIRVDSDRTPDTIAAIVAAPPASTSDARTVTPATIVVLTTAPAPATSSTATTSPATIEVSTTLPAPATSTGATIEPATVAAVVSLPLTTVEGASNATRVPDPIAVVVSVPSATTSGTADANAQPATVAVLADLPAATARGHRDVAVATTAVTVSLPAPSTTSTATTAPAPINLVAALPSATVAAGALRSPDAIAVVVNLDGATASGTTAVAPDTITLLVAAAQAVIEATSLVTPTTIPLVVTFPAPDLVTIIVPTPAERTWILPARNGVWVMSSDRTWVMPARSSTWIMPARDATWTIPEDPRTWTIT